MHLRISPTYLYNRTHIYYTNYHSHIPLVAYSTLEWDRGSQAPHTHSRMKDIALCDESALYRDHGDIAFDPFIDDDYGTASAFGTLSVFPSRGIFPSNLMSASHIGPYMTTSSQHKPETGYISLVAEREYPTTTEARRNQLL